MPLPQPNPKSCLKRNREENWSDEEKKTLLSLVKIEILIIEDKSTETNTNKRKHLAWKEIAEKFHMITGKNRPANKMIDQWKRMKAQAKRNVAAFEKSRRATGGGQNKVKVTDLDWAVKELVPHYFFRDKNPYDDDGYEDQFDMDTETQQSPSLLRDFHPSQSQLQFTGMDIEGMDAAPIRERHSDTCTTYVESQPSPSLRRPMEPSVIVQEFDVIQTGGYHSPIIPLMEVAEAPRQRIQRTLALPTREINFNQRNEIEAVENDSSPRDVPAPRTRVQRTLALPTREINFNQRNEIEAVENDSSPRDVPAPRTRVQRTPALPTREINFNQRNEIEAVENDSPPHDVPAPRTRVQRKRKFNEAEYHKLLIKKKEEEYDDKAKQRKELHELELQKRKIEIEILQLTKQKVEEELRKIIN